MLLKNFSLEKGLYNGTIQDLKSLNFEDNNNLLVNSPYCLFGVNKRYILFSVLCLLLNLIRLDVVDKILTLLEDERLSPKVKKGMYIQTSKIKATDKIRNHVHFPGGCHKDRYSVNTCCSRLTYNF